MASNDPAPAQTLDSKPAPTGGVAVASAEPAGPAERQPPHESGGGGMAARAAWGRSSRPSPQTSW